MKATDRALARIMLAAAPALLMATPAAAQQKYSSLYVFGDSLVDAGNAQEGRRLTGGADPAPTGLGYFQGRFSNEANFADYLSISVTGNRTTASAFGGLNFSVGGAQFREVANDASPSFAEQISPFSGAGGRKIDGDAPVLLTFGGNDVRSELTRYGGFLTAGRPQDFVADFTATLNALAAGLNTLYDSGARNFIVTGLPNIGQIPNVTTRGVPALIQKGEELSRRLNADYTTPTVGDDERDIKDVVATFAGDKGANAQFFDLFAYQQRLNAAPQDFGLPANLNQRDICLTTPGAAPGCDGFVYFDDVHPTTQIHRAIADGLTTQLGLPAVPEPASWVLMIAGFALVASTIRRRRYALRVVYA